MGEKCPRWGNLFDHVVSILCQHRPQYFILENVANLSRHNSGATWDAMKVRLEELGYSVKDSILSPHRFGIPQIRPRMFIVGSLIGLEHFSWPEPDSQSSTTILSVLDGEATDTRSIPNQVLENLQVWQSFISRYPQHEQLPSFPIWSMEFGATYPYENETPYVASTETLGRYKGSYGIQLGGLARDEMLAALPSHARREQAMFPAWKRHYIRLNRDLYNRHKSWIDEWLPEIRRFPPSFQKLEWNCKGEQRHIWDYIIQVRASGIRVKRSTTAPSLVSMTTTQIPIIGWQRRYLTTRECLRLQSMDDLSHLPRSLAGQIRAIGNAVNVRVAESVARALIAYEGRDQIATV